MPANARHHPAPSPPPAAPEAITGLAAIRAHGGRDDALYLTSDITGDGTAYLADRPMTSEEMVRFIKKTEQLVRMSREYKWYVGYLRSELGMNHCSFLPNVDVSTDEVGLEMHHTPLTLYDIVDLIASHRLARGQGVTSMSIADEVLAAHMRNLVGLCPLLASVHKMAHAGVVTIHPAQVHGDWLQLLRDYPDGVTEDMVERLVRFCSITEAQMRSGLSKLSAAGPPRLRRDARVPSADEVRVLLLGRG